MSKIFNDGALSGHIFGYHYQRVENATTEREYNEAVADLCELLKGSILSASDKSWAEFAKYKGLDK